MAWWRRGRDKKRLEEVFREQLNELDMGIPLSNPPLHPYLQIWIACRKYGNGMTGMPCLPDGGSYLDQDAELMLAFDLAIQLYEEIETGKKNAHEKLAAMKQSVGAD